MESLIKKIIEEEVLEKEIINDFKKTINYLESDTIRKLFLSPLETDEDREKLGDIVSIRSDQMLRKKYPNFKTQFEVEDDILYYYLVDENNNDVFKYTRYT